MYGLNFCEPTPAARVLNAVLQIGVAFRPLPVRLMVFAMAAGLVFVAIDVARLNHVLTLAANREAERDLLVAEARRVDASRRALRQKESAVVAALRVRKSNAAVASMIARLGNVLEPKIALTTFRSWDSGLDVGGRGPTLGDVREALEHLSAVQGADEGLTLEVHQEEATAKYATFHFGFSERVAQGLP